MQMQMLESVSSVCPDPEAPSCLQAVLAGLNGEVSIECPGMSLLVVCLDTPPRGPPLVLGLTWTPSYEVRLR